MSREMSIKLYITRPLFFNGFGALPSRKEILLHDQVTWENKHLQLVVGALQYLTSVSLIN